MSAATLLSLAVVFLSLCSSFSAEIHYKEIDISSLTCQKMENVEPLHGCRFSVFNETDQQVSCKLAVKQKQDGQIASAFRTIMLNTMNFHILDSIPTDHNIYCASIASIRLQRRDNELTENHTETDLPPGFVSFLNFFTDDSFAQIDFRKKVPVAMVTLIPECHGLLRKDLRAECVDQVLFMKEFKRGTFKLDFHDDNFWSFLKRRFVENLGAELTQLSLTTSGQQVHVPLQFITRVLSQQLRMRELTAAGFPLGQLLSPLISMQSLQVLRLPGDSITKLNEAALQFVPELKELDLSENELEELPQALPRELRTLNVAHNKLSTLNTSLLTSLTTLNISSNNISTMPEPLPAGLRTLDASSNNLSWLPQALPAGLRILDASHNLLQTLPDYLPTTLRVLQVSHNRLQTLGPQLLVALQELQRLDMSHNELSTADDVWLANHMQLINVSNNELKNFRLVGPGNVTHVDASYNQIDSWKVRSDRLTLVGNPRAALGLKFLRADDSTMAIDLGDNLLLNCDPCVDDGEVPFELSQWMAKQEIDASLSGPHVVRPKVPVCTEPQEVSGIAVVNVSGLDDKSFCPGSPRYVAQSVLLLISVLAVTVALSALCYMRRYEITYVWYLMMMRRERVAAERRYPSSYKYDAFVSYSSSDRAWVIGQLQPKLESSGDSPDEPGLRLCLHERDFALGSYIADNIVASMKDSRSTVIVLSQAFVESQWCRWELEVASNKVHHLVLLELERLNRSRLPRNLRYLMDTRTYMEWPSQPRAQEAKWKQLRSVLAAPRGSREAAAEEGASGGAGAPAASEQPQQNGCLKEPQVSP